MAVQGITAPGLHEAESYALQQYEKIIRFRDDVLDGKHATIKLPDSLREAALSLPTNALLVPSAGKLPVQNNTASASNAGRAVGHSSAATPTVAPPIQPPSIYLSKTDEMLRAQLQIQRKRIEQELQEDVRRHRYAKPAGSGAPDGLNASAILAAALILVPELDLSAGSGNGPENDSFDDNTFYSSQHDTPEFQPASPAPISPVAPAVSIPAAQSATANVRAANTIPAKTQNERRSMNQPRQLRNYEELTEPATVRPAASKQSSTLPGLNNYNNSAAGPSNQARAPASATAAPTGGQVAPTQPSSYIDMHPPSPLLQNSVRAAPSYASLQQQPRDIPGLYGNTQNVAPNTGAPAQVAALRSEPGSRTSPESSSQGGNSRRKNRRKKRKSDKQALESQQSFESSTHHIKAEPRSPSPLAGPSYIRPNKRQRQVNNQNPDLSYDELSYDPAMPSGPGNPAEPEAGQQRRSRPSAAYASTAGAVPSNARVSREYVTERVIADDSYRREYVPQAALPYEYATRGSHISRAVHPEAYPDGARPYGTSPQAARYSIHPEGDAFHESTRPPPARILVDAYGREFIEPARQIIRHSMAPSPLPGEAERLYERAPAQPLPRYHGSGALEERGYLFAQPAPRRVVTQPEYVAYDHRDGRFREYSARPLGAPEEFVSVRPQEHRIYDGGREYIGRASSMHPVEQTRVPSGLGPYGHASSVRPEASGVVYGIDRTAQQPGIKNYSWVADREVGSSLYAAPSPNEAGSSRGPADQDAVYGRGRQDAFR